MIIFVYRLWAKFHYEFSLRLLKEFPIVKWEWNSVEISSSTFLKACDASFQKCVSWHFYAIWLLSCLRPARCDYRLLTRGILLSNYQATIGTKISLNPFICLIFAFLLLRPPKTAILLEKFPFKTKWYYFGYNIRWLD